MLDYIRNGVLDNARWTPAALGAALKATVLPAMSRSAGLLWQDAAKTVPAVADGDPVRVAVCPFTAVEFTAPSDATRPTLQNSGSSWWLEFDGVDDYLAAGDIMTGATAGYIVTRIQAPGGDGSTEGMWVWVASGGGGADDPKSYYNLATDIYEAFGTTVRRTIDIAPGVLADTDRTWEVAAAAGAWDGWLDGTNQLSTGTNTLATWATAPRVGNNSQNPFEGRFYGIVLANAIPPERTRVQIRQYMAALSP
jgi:hypothetical protein